MNPAELHLNAALSVQLLGATAVPPLVVSWRGPVVALLGTVTVSVVAVAAVTGATAQLLPAVNRTVLAAGVRRNPVPVRTVLPPTLALLGVKLRRVGSGARTVTEEI